MATWKELLEAKKLASQPKADGALQSPATLTPINTPNSSLINSAWNSPSPAKESVSLTLAERLAAIKAKKSPSLPSTLIVSIQPQPSAEKPGFTEKEKEKKRRNPFP